MINPIIYDFKPDGVHLHRIIIGSEGKWVNPDHLNLTNTEIIEIGANGHEQSTFQSRYEIVEKTPAESFKPLLKKPAELNSIALSKYITALKGVTSEEIAYLRVAYYRRTSDLLAPIIMVLIGVPFGVVFGRSSAFLSLGLALLTGLAVWATSSAFQQFGNYRLLPPSLAAWGPILIFSTLGIIALSRTRT
jgi:lipopolysaccharide export LptBFGC system permease protein LptF